jgi:hypothetical protein
MTYSTEPRSVVAAELPTVKVDIVHLDRAER